MRSEGQCYSVDTSGLIDGLERYYPEALFPALWGRVDELVDEGRFLISEEVWIEVCKQTNAVKAWCEPRRDRIIVPTDAAVAVEVQRILTAHERFVMEMKNRNRADPFVIAVARLRNATVVTGEGSDGNANRPKIPYVCSQLGVPCVRLIDVIRTEGWSFA